MIETTRTSFLQAKILILNIEAVKCGIQTYFNLVCKIYFFLKFIFFLQNLHDYVQIVNIQWSFKKLITHFFKCFT